MDTPAVKLSAGLSNTVKGGIVATLLVCILISAGLVYMFVIKPKTITKATVPVAPSQPIAVPSQVAPSQPIAVPSQVAPSQPIAVPSKVAPSVSNTTNTTVPRPYINNDINMISTNLNILAEVSDISSTTLVNLHNTATTKFNIFLESCKECGIAFYDAAITYHWDQSDFTAKYRTVKPIMLQKYLEFIVVLRAFVDEAANLYSDNNTKLRSMAAGASKSAFADAVTTLKDVWKIASYKLFIHVDRQALASVWEYGETDINTETTIIRGMMTTLTEYYNNSTISKTGAAREVIDALNTLSNILPKIQTYVLDTQANFVAEAARDDPIGKNMTLTALVRLGSITPVYWASRRHEAAKKAEAFYYKVSVDILLSLFPLMRSINSTHPLIATIESRLNIAKTNYASTQIAADAAVAAANIMKVRWQDT
jgi:hypothetical protein